MAVQRKNLLFRTLCTILAAVVVLSALVSLWGGSACGSVDPNNNDSAGVCGNGVVEEGERCDDGNLLDDLGCSADCQSFCGDGVQDEQLGEDCDGGDCCSAACTFVAADTECRAAADVCDVAETCDGASANCPDDVAAGAGKVCRAARGLCDLTEVCDGSSIECPADEFALAGLQCRPSTGPCDPAEACSGVSPECPVDAVITQCGDGDGCCPAGCDVMSDFDCAGDAIPAVSEWGLLILALFLATGLKLGFRRRPSCDK